MGIARDCITVWNAAASGVVAKTAQTRQKYWKNWAKYASLCGIDPFLLNVPPLERDVVVTAFAARVRKGTYGRGAQIRVSGVTDALAAISKTIELAGQPSPLYRADQKYTLSIERMVEGFRREDPPSTPQLAVPVIVPHTCYKAGLLSEDPKITASGCLATIAFYFLLRVGEYTQPRFIVRNGKKVRATRTKQFSVGDIGFFKDGKILSRTSSLEILLTADAATLKISNQKNGRMGETIHHQAIGKEGCPIQALARRVHHVLHHKGTVNNLLCDYWKDGQWMSINSIDIINLVRSSVKTLGLHKNGIDADLVGSHSLRAGGAMALKLNNHSDTTIKKMGRWSSLTFLQYIHTQISHLSKDLSKDMSRDLPFLNIATIEGH